jgi:hypothetical protein
MARGRTTTIPLPPCPFPFDVPCVQGRTGGGTTLWWPGGPLASCGHGGRGLLTLPSTGSGLGVGRGVGCGVGRTVGRGVDTSGDGDGRVDPAVGVGITATTGGSVGAAVDAVGLADGSTEGSSGTTDGPTDGATPDGVGSGLVLVELVGAGSLAIGDAAGRVGAGVPRLPAMPPFGRAGATSPAVNATVARMRFRSPRATTRRAR